MTMAETALLARFKADLVALYGARLEKVVLFGSRARGDAREDSDWDLALSVHGMGRWYDESRPLSRLSLEFFDTAGIWIQAIPIPAETWDDRTPLMHEIRKDGIAI